MHFFISKKKVSFEINKKCYLAKQILFSSKAVKKTLESWCVSDLSVLGGHQLYL